MEELAKWAEGELKRYKTFWWFYFFFPELLLLLQYLMAPLEGPGAYSPNVPGYTALILFMCAFSFVSLVVFGRYPSESKVKNILLGQAGKSPLPQRKTSLFGPLFLGMLALVEIPVFGFILLFSSAGVPELERFTPIGYFLLLLGIIALVLHRLRATRVVRETLREIGAKLR